MPEQTNTLWHADNSDALPLIEKDFFGKIKCCYIDPPYNNKTKWSHYSDSAPESKYIEWMHDVCSKTRPLLSDDGFFWMSCDSLHAAYLVVELDKIFGRNNFLGSVCWKHRHGQANQCKFFSRNYENILCWAKNKKVAPQFNLIPRSEECISNYKNPDNDPRGAWTPSSISQLNGHYQYPIVSPSGAIFSAPTGRGWIHPEEVFLSLKADNRIWFGKKGNSAPTKKYFLSEVRDGVCATDLWLDAGTTSISKKEVREINSEDVFQTPKPEALIEKILYLCTNEGDWVLDCFAGSGTTGVVANKMGRRWIMAEKENTVHTHIVPRLQKIDAQFELREHV